MRGNQRGVYQVIEVYIRYKLYEYNKDYTLHKIK